MSSTQKIVLLIYTPRLHCKQIDLFDLLEAWRALYLFLHYRENYHSNISYTRYVSTLYPALISSVMFITWFWCARVQFSSVKTAVIRPFASKTKLAGNKCTFVITCVPEKRRTNLASGKKRNDKLTLAHLRTIIT
jgi:hypothetical protein